MTHFEREIAEQPQVLSRILEDPAVPALATELRGREVPLIATLARGSSDNAVTFFAYLAGMTLGLPVASIPPSLLTLYAARPRLRGALGIGVSQSGESTDVVEGLEALKAAGAITLAVTNDAGSSLARGADHALAQHAGVEEAVAASKTFTSQMMVLARLVAEWADDDGLRAALAAVPSALETLLGDLDALERAALRLTHAGGLYVLGRGLSFAAALETALKLKETAYIDAQAYSSAEFQHGPIAVVDPGDPLLLLGMEDASLDGNLEVAARLREAGADLTVMSGAPALLERASAAIPLPEGLHEATAGFVMVVAGQLLAERLAASRGVDPDTPRLLKKVTRTR
ncbi:MAG TPA: SIS domain-containing protein [Trueperaceae bacterium]|nr:SIS domain-containing protein [Trueperaceae bacterium]